LVMIGGIKEQWWWKLLFFIIFLFLITRGGHQKSLTSQNIIFIGMHEDRLY
jgi:hypothetical protein